MDWLTILLVLVMVLLGWVNIFAASYSQEDFTSIFDISQRYGKQLLWIGFAIVIAVMVLIIDSKFYEAFSFPIYGLILLLLLLVLVIGTEVKGATSWIAIGSFRLQPAEFMKFAATLAMAKVISKFNFSFSKPKDLALVFLVVFTPAVLIVLQNDTGSALVYTALVLAMFREGLSSMYLITALLAASYFIGVLVLGSFAVLLIIYCIPLIAFVVSRSWREVIAWSSILLFSLALFFASRWISPLTYTFVTGFAIVSLAIYLALLAFVKKIYLTFIWAPFLILSLAYALSVNYAFTNVLGQHQSTRIQVLLGLKSDPLGAGYNVTQSKIAIGSGGLSGKGFLNGTQTKFDFVPEQATDFIFCTVGEEWGFLGTSLVILLFVVLLLRLIYMAERQRSQFSRVYGYGLVSILFFHFAINIAMTIGLAPVIGIPLPFFSYGGSSLWGFTFLMFIFLRLDANRKEVLGS